MSTVSAPTLDGALTDPQFVDNPYPVYARLRAEEPVYWSDAWQQWVVTRYEDVQAVTKDPERFSSEGWEASYLSGLPPDLTSNVPDLVRHYRTHVLSNTDPPSHARLRNLVVRSFTPRVVERLRPGITRLVDHLLNRLEDGKRADLIAEFCYPLPATVIAELLGAPESGRERFEQWSADLVSFVGSGRPLADRAIKANAGLAQFRSFLEPALADARRNPRDDLLSFLAGSAGMESFAEDELVATCVTLLFAGHETTANLLGNGLLALLQSPTQLDLLRSDPTLTETAVEELLRFDSPVQRLRRRATTTIELRGRTITAGQLVMAFTGSANRDPDRFPKPDELDLTRGDRGHLAFGHGIHFCVGAALTRLEAEIALNAVLQRFPNLRLDPARRVAWKPNITFRGLETLPVLLH